MPTQASILSRPPLLDPAAWGHSIAGNLRNPPENIVRRSGEKIAAHYKISPTRRINS